MIHSVKTKLMPVLTESLRSACTICGIYRRRVLSVQFFNTRTAYCAVVGCGGYCLGLQEKQVILTRQKERHLKNASAIAGEQGAQRSICDSSGASPSRIFGCSSKSDSASGMFLTFRGSCLTSRCNSYIPKLDFPLKPQETTPFCRRRYF